MNTLLYWWCSLEPVARSIFLIAAASILPILYFVCRRLHRRWIWWIMLVCVTIPLFLGLTVYIVADFYQSKSISAWINASPYGCTVDWVDTMTCLFTNIVLLLVFGFTMHHCFSQTKGRKQSS